MRGYRVLTFTKCTTIMIAELTVTSGLGSSLEYRAWLWNGLGMEWLWLCNGFGYGMVLDRDNFSIAL
jgi:hypothetical protein